MERIHGKRWTFENICQSASGEVSGNSIVVPCCEPRRPLGSVFFRVALYFVQPIITVSVISERERDVHVRYMLSPVRLLSVCLSSVTFVRPTQAVEIGATWRIQLNLCIPRPT